MADTVAAFNDGAAYECFMGRWSRAAGAIFLDWVAPPDHAHWLDIGCGTGVFTQLVLDACSPATVTAVDSASAQIDHARTRVTAHRADFRVADAQSLPFPDCSFDIVASALVINFVRERPLALAEMRRVCRPGGIVALYVWDFAAGCSPGWPVARGMHAAGIEVPQMPGSGHSSIEALRLLFERSRYERIETRSIEVTTAFPDFEDFWQSQIPAFTPNGEIIAALPHTDRAKLVDAIRDTLLASPDGKIAYSARANAVKARVRE